MTYAQTAGKPVSTNTAPHTDTINTTKIRICAPSRGQLLHVPLWVIYSHDEVIYKSDTLSSKPVGNLSPDYIKSIIVLKGENATVKYGGIAKNGAIEIYINDEKYPEARKLLQADTTQVKKKL